MTDPDTAAPTPPLISRATGMPLPTFEEALDRADMAAFLEWVDRDPERTFAAWTRWMNS